MCLPWHWHSYARCWSTLRHCSHYHHAHNRGLETSLTWLWCGQGILNTTWVLFRFAPLQASWSFASCLSQVRNLTTSGYPSPTPLPWVGILILIFIDASETDSPAKRAFRSRKRYLDLQGECYGADKGQCLYHWRWTFCAGLQLVL